jgi:hypothetical protein
MQIRHLDSEEDLQKANAKPWMLEQLQLNPEYVSWGPYEDYMYTREDSGWNSRIIVETFKERM